MGSFAGTYERCIDSAGCWTEAEAAAAAAPEPLHTTSGDVCPGNCDAPSNCWHSQWAVPCSDASGYDACIESGGCWTSESPSPGPAPAPSSDVCPGRCADGNDCYHQQWAVPCSFAGTYERCIDSAGCWTEEVAAISV